MKNYKILVETDKDINIIKNLYIKNTPDTVDWWKFIASMIHKKKKYLIISEDFKHYEHCDADNCNNCRLACVSYPIVTVSELQREEKLKRILNEY